MTRRHRTPPARALLRSALRPTAGLVCATALVVGAAASPVVAAPSSPTTATTATDASPARLAPARPFDLQAHRGGVALTVESTLPAFARALRLGVSTLELDTQVTEDGVALVTHDRRIGAHNCRDTAPATVGDPDYPYVGDYVRDLTAAQVRTLDCGSLRREGYPQQQLASGSRMATLTEVLDLVRRYGADDVELNVETKVEAGAPQETAPRGRFVRTVLSTIDEAGMLDRVSIQSFDWGSLMLVQDLEPSVPVVALTNIDFLQVGQPGASPWLGGIDADDFDGDLVRAAASFGADAISPVHGTPQDGAVGDPGYVRYVTPRMVRDAHAADMEVIPWTVNDAETMTHLVRRGVDGLITDRPDVLRDVLAESGEALPAPVPSPHGRPAVAVPGTHAHNDYEHERPLRDALANGLTSIEADVWLVDGELLVAHDLEDVRPRRSLERLYLEPLARRVERLGSAYAGSDEPLQLMIDVKSDAAPTHAALVEALAPYRSMLTRYAPTVREGAVQVVVSGNRDRAAMESAVRRFVALDGRLPDLEGDAGADLVPMISDNWTNAFTWDGTGEIPPAEHRRLLAYARQAEASGQTLRFWAVPDTRGVARERMWAVLLDAGVDWISSDDLTGVSEFVANRSQALP